MNAQLPYSKFIGLNNEQLEEGHFKYDKNRNQFVLRKTNGLIGISTTTGQTSALVKSIDESYNVYTYTIYTGLPPYSKWHTKEAEKKAKRDAKGKKKDINDLM